MPNIIFNIPYHICNSSLSRIWLVDLSANILASNFLSMRIWRNKGKRLSRNLSHTLAQCLVAMELVEILQYLFFGSLTPPWYSNEVHASCCNIAFQSCYISSFPDNMFYHAWTSMSTTMFKLTNSTMFKPAVNRQKQAMGFYVCRWRPFRNYASVANESTPLVESLVDWSKGDRSAVGCWKVQIYFFDVRRKRRRRMNCAELIQVVYKDGN